MSPTLSIIAFWFLGIWMIAGLIYFAVIIYRVIRRKRALKNGIKLEDLKNR